jgi:hypothetical protein
MTRPPDMKGSCNIMNEIEMADKRKSSNWELNGRITIPNGKNQHNTKCRRGPYEHKN